MKPLSFIIVGSGFRSKFFMRIAKAYPQEFDLKFVLCRSKEKAAKIAEEMGVSTTTSIEACEAAKPDFVIVAVDRDHLGAVAMEWAKKGYPVMTETPIAATVEELKQIWAMKEQGAKITTVEQYHRYPTIVGGINQIKAGKIGTPNVMYISLAHDYHGTSLIRRILGNGIEPVTLRGAHYSFPVMETDSREGRIYDGRIVMKDRDHVTMEFASGKVAFYDFSPVQYRSFIRSRHLTVQGERGEWSDMLLYYADENNQTHAEQILPYIDPKYPSFDTKELRDMTKYWKPELFLEQQQDEYAIATLMADMRQFIEDGTEPYPLAEALEDAYLWLLFMEAEQNPDKVVKSEAMPWHNL